MAETTATRALTAISHQVLLAEAMLAECGSLWLEGLEAHFFVDYQCCGQKSLEDVSQLPEALCPPLLHHERQRHPTVLPFHTSKLWVSAPITFQRKLFLT